MLEREDDLVGLKGVLELRGELNEKSWRGDNGNPNIDLLALLWKL